jgi:hypothetical protein
MREINEYENRHGVDGSQVIGAGLVTAFLDRGYKVGEFPRPPYLSGIALLIVSHCGDHSSVCGGRLYCGLISICCGILPAGGRTRV